MPNKQLKTVAAVDMGSNSFRMIIARVNYTDQGYQLIALDQMRETIRLAAGLNENKILDMAAQERGLKALKLFGERLQHFSPNSVRAVATNTLRVAKNAPDFIKRAEAVLGFPIEVIAGREEARLIYAGVSHAVPYCEGHRLVIDIGGGSTEVIIGDNHTPIAMESLLLGCVSLSQQYFPDVFVTKAAFEESLLHAKREIQLISESYHLLGWNQVIGSSGTARALADILVANHFNPRKQPGITLEGLIKLKNHILKVGRVDQLKLAGIKPDRIPVLAGGLAIMLALFEELQLTAITTSDGALRYGVLYDLIGRHQSNDIREVTVKAFMQRYDVDEEHAKAVAEVAQYLLDQLPVTHLEEQEKNHMLVRWAAMLHEMGLMISHAGYHKHSAYIALHADMPGFSRVDQIRLSDLLLGQIGKLNKLADHILMDWRLLFALRLSIVLNRKRILPDYHSIQVEVTNSGFKVFVPEAWREKEALKIYSINQEAQLWKKMGWTYELIYTTQ